METSSHIPEGLPSTEELRKTDAYWPATLYLRVGMIYLRDNPLLSKPLRIEHVKNRGLPMRASP
jgi:xylulose-5-phosphate/fructose-6-phosphate phosphoketolase